MQRGEASPETGAAESSKCILVSNQSSSRSRRNLNVYLHNLNFYMLISKLMLINRRINKLYQDHRFRQRSQAKEIELIL